MDKETMLKILKTKSGKTCIVFEVLSVISLIGGFIDIENLGTGIIGFLLFFVIAVVFLNKGKKEANVTVNTSTPASSGNTISARPNKFKPTKKVEKYFYVDDVSKQFRVPCSKESKAIYSFADLLDYELIENGNTVAGGSLGRAIVGGLAFGKVGAIVGGTTGKQKATCSKLQIKITVKDIKHPALYITLLDFEVKKDGMIYQNSIKSAQEIISLLQIIKSFD